MIFFIFFDDFLSANIKNKKYYSNIFLIKKYFIINVDVRTSLRALRLIPWALKLTIM